MPPVRIDGEKHDGKRIKYIPDSDREPLYAHRQSKRGKAELIEFYVVHGFFSYLSIQTTIWKIFSAMCHRPDFFIHSFGLQFAYVFCLSFQDINLAILFICS